MKNINNRGFVVTGAMLAWLLGITAIVGGGGYMATHMLSDDYENHEQYYEYGESHKGDYDKSDHDSMNDDIYQMPKTDLSNDERTTLLLMREEEKLAKDVYDAMYDMWGVRIFDNISESEEKHEDTIKSLLNKYDIQDPVEEYPDGVFASSEMQSLYNNLISRGSGSLVEALKVGITIEELDIRDLRLAIEQTDNEDLSLAYNKLMQASYNHLRAFDKQLDKSNVGYTPKYLSQEQIDAILAGGQDRRGRGDMGQHSGKMR